MLAVSYRYAKDKAEAEDILQDAFIKVFINLKILNLKVLLKDGSERLSSTLHCYKV